MPEIFSDFQNIEDISIEVMRDALVAKVLESLDDLALVFQTVLCSNEEAEVFVSGYGRLVKTSKSVKRRILLDARIISTVDLLQTGILELGMGYFTTDECNSNLAILSRINASCHVLGASDFETKIFLKPDKCITIPGTNISVFSNTDIGGGKISSMTFSRTDGSYSVDDESYSLEYKDSCLRLAWAEAALTPRGEQESLLRNDETNRELWLHTLEQADIILANHKCSNALVKNYGSIIVPIKSEQKDTLSSVSYDTHPGCIFTSWCGDPKLLAETLVHESDHQRHYYFTRHMNFWIESMSEASRIYKSPWRVDARPLDGILRGASAFVSVSELWENCLAKDDGSNWHGHRATLTNYQALEAINILENTSGLSKQGLSLVEWLKSRAVRVKDELLSAPNFEKWLNFAETEQQQHDEIWKTNNHSIREAITVCWNANLYTGM